MNRSNRSVLLTLVLFAGLFTACNANSNKTETNTESTEMTTPEQPVAPAIADDPNWAKTDGMYAEITTATQGKIVCRLEYKKAPLTVANFVALAEGKMKNNVKPEGTPFYDSLIFHRCIPNFMIQGGDPQGTGMGGPGYSFADEFDPTLRFDGPGVLAMANSGPATNGSQFFITHKETPWLNDKHSIFGKVVEGQAAVNAIQNGEKMVTVKIIRVGDEAKKFDAPKVFEQKTAAAKAKADAEAKALTMSIEELVKTQYPTAKKTASGLYYIVEKEGTGPKAEKGKTVSVHYTGTLANGKKFDSSYDRNQPLPFTLGKGQVIQGWDEGIAMMRVGSKVKLIIPSNLGYGDNGYPPVIPGKAILIFDTELMDVK